MYIQLVLSLYIIYNHVVVEIFKFIANKNINWSMLMFFITLYCHTILGEKYITQLQKDLLEG